jgi:regulation of enolase protein 1 (concanavalin A-like superfamily)
MKGMHPVRKSGVRFAFVTYLVVLATAMTDAGSRASAEAFKDDFESYAVGSNIHGQGGWKGYNNNPDLGALVSDAFACNGSRSIEVADKGDLIHEYDITGGKWLFSVMQYVPSESAGYAYVYLLSQYDDRSAPDAKPPVWSTFTRFQVASRIVSTKRSDGTAAKIVFDRWIENKFIIDLDENTIEAYYDGILIDSGTWDADERKTLGAIDLHSRDGATVYYDDVSLVPYVDVLGGVSHPRPADDANDVPCDVVLEWKPGAFALGHDVYLGADYDAVSMASRAHPQGVLVSQGQASARFDPTGLLVFGQTYYWRIDEVNGPPDNTIFKGPVWSFTTEPYAYPVEQIGVTSNSVWGEGEGPENTINGSGLNADDEHSVQASDMWLGEASGADAIFIEYAFDRAYKMHEMWVWNYNIQFEPVLGFGLKDVTIECSEDGTDWAVLADVGLAQATGEPTYTANTTIAFGGVAARYVRLTVGSGWGTLGRFGLSEVRFLYIPTHARQPQPADGETGVVVAPTFGWRAGREAALHEVYLSTEEAAVADGSALLDVIDEASYAPGVLEFSRTYFWKVNEANEAEAISVWEGDIWTFTTIEFGIIDDFERYDEDDPIFETWIDGWTNETGSTVGHIDGPFVERSIVHGGRQSMPLHYDNRSTPFYSETERDFGSVDWTSGGAEVLRLFVSGQAPSFFEHPDGSILMNGFGRQFGMGWNDDKDELRFAYKELTGDGAITVRVDGVAHTSESAMAGVMIREGLHASARHATVAVEADRGVSFQHRRMADGDSERITEGVAMPQWVRLTRTGNTFTVERSGDGATWVSIGEEAADATVEIPMAANVLVGLMVTSHNSRAATSAEFSDLTITGSVTDDWQTAGVGAAQVPGNAMEPVYVAIEDGGGNAAVVAHPDPSVAGRVTWQEWRIALSAFGGVDMANVAKLSIGVGGRLDPAAGGEGLVFIDDIGIGRPSPGEQADGTALVVQ